LARHSASEWALILSNIAQFLPEKEGLQVRSVRYNAHSKSRALPAEMHILGIAIQSSRINIPGGARQSMGRYISTSKLYIGLQC